MMLVDCQTCPVRDVHCADCMVTALTAIPMRSGLPGGGRRPVAVAATTEPGPTAATTGPTGPVTHRTDGSDGGAVRTAPLDRAERRAVSALLAAGLVTTATADAARAEVERVAGTQARGPHAVRDTHAAHAAQAPHRDRRAV